MRCHLLLLLVLPSLASAQDCALDAKSITPQLSAKLPKGARVLSTKREKKKVRQVLKLADGLEVSVEFGGCEKVQYAFGIKGGGLTTRTVGAEVVAVARRVLPMLPMSKDALAEPKVLLTALDEGSFTALPATMSCGTSGTCRIELVPEPKKKKPSPKKAPKGEAPKTDEDEPATLVLSYEAPI